MSLQNINTKISKVVVKTVRKDVKPTKKIDLLERMRRVSVKIDVPIIELVRDGRRFE